MGVSPMFGGTGAFPAIWVSLALLFSNATPPVQQAAANAQPANTLQEVLKVTTHLVQVNVTVQDHKGQPVIDLKREDFELYDSGQLQEIRQFSMEKSQPSVPSAGLPEGVVSNRIATVGKQAQPMPNALTVILLDDLNTNWGDRTLAKQGVVRFLRQLRPGDQTAIYVLGQNGLSVLHEFTSDTGALLRDLEQHRGVESALLSGTNPDRATAGLANRSNGRQANFYKSSIKDQSLDALVNIANHLAGMTGRKNLIWVSDGFPVFVNRDYVNMHEDLRRAMAAINATGLAIYPVDAKGLNPTDALTAIAPGYTPPSGRSRITTPRPNLQPTFELQNTMAEIADCTGGRAFMNTNDIAGSIRRAMDDSAATYTLAFNPTHNQWDGRYREIKIKLKRGGLEAHYRKGYAAVGDVSENAEARKAVLLEGLTSPLLYTGLGIVAKVVEPPAPETPHLRMRFVMDTEDINFRQDARGLWIADLDMVTVVRNARGEELKQLVRTMHLELRQRQFDDYQRNGMSWTADLDAPSGSVDARLVVRDVVSGQMGSVDLQIASGKT